MIAELKKNTETKMHKSVEAFKADLAKVVGGANSLVTFLDVRLMEVRLDPDGFVVIAREKADGEA